MQTFRRTLGATIAFLLFAPAQTLAQVPTINLNLATPGARANAMGRAFIGVADDATATITNPAGLVYLTRPQVYAEFTNTGFEPFEGVSLRLSSLSFLAISSPAGSRLALGFTRNQFLNYDDNDLQVRGTSYAGSIAGRVHPKLRLGGTISFDNVSSESDSSSSWSPGFVVGALWLPNEIVSVGFQGAKGSSHRDDFDFHNPDRVGIGVAARASPRLLTAADVVWLNASETFTDSGLVDVTEFHFGGEYLAIPGMNQLFVRAGGYVSSNEEEGNPNPAHAATFGVGFTSGQRFQTDFAYVTANNRIVLSAAFRFQ